MKNRTGIDFSNHEHFIEVYKCGDKEIRIDHLKIPGSRTNYIQYINTDEVLTVTGDFGNWVFNRPFVPSGENAVSDHYWIEKLRIASSQKPSEYDPEETQKELERMIDSGLEDDGYEGEQLEEIQEFFKELLSYVEDELEYIHHAYRTYNIPVEYDQIPVLSSFLAPLSKISLMRDR